MNIEVEQVDKSQEYLKELYGDANSGLEKLKSVTIFSAFTDDELKKIYSFGEFVSLKPQCYAVVEGDSSRGLYIILKGTLSVHKTDLNTGNLARLAFLEEGAPFGELSLFDDAPRSATVAAENQTHLFYLSEPKFAEFLNESGTEIQTRFYKCCAEFLVRRFREQNEDYINAQSLLWKHALRKEN